MTAADTNDARTAMLMASPFGTVVSDWLAFTGRIMDFNETVCTGIKAIGPIAIVSGVLGTITSAVTDEQREHIGRAFQSAKSQIDTDFELVHALTLLAAWGAFEAFVEDVCKALLVMDRSLLTSKSFENVKIPAPMLVGDPSEQIDFVFNEASKKMNSDLKIGVGRFEPLLELVGLNGNGDISDGLKEAIFYAQQTRHVWAHRAGKADKRFLERCPNKGFALGDTVKISTEQSNLHLHALMTYGVLIVNRFLAAHGVNPIPYSGDENSAFADPYAERWGTMPKRPKSAENSKEPVTGWWEESPDSE